MLCGGVAPRGAIHRATLTFGAQPAVGGVPMAPVLAALPTPLGRSGTQAEWTLLYRWADTLIDALICITRTSHYVYVYMLG